MPNGTIDPLHDYVADLDPNSATRWPTLAAARSNAEAVRKLLTAKLREFTSDDVDLIVFGSLGRAEWTSGSDVDWTLLIDGQASAEHRIAAREVERVLSGLDYEGKKLKGPGTEGIFGNMAFGHEIVHHIGGQVDTNRNTTQRVLLLLEAVALRDSDEELGPCERIVRQVLNRYLASDSNFHTKTDQTSRIPRFLLNDIVRYWRTMCVDFAYKDWEQAGKIWALRNIKLRTSRKMLFVAGFLTVFSCYQNDALRRPEEKTDDYVLKLQAHLLNFVHSTPLNIITWALQSIGLEKQCTELIDLHEEVLALLNDQEVRNRLSTLSERDVYEDDTFLKCRDVSHRMQDVVRQVCFDIESPLRDFTHDYGVF